MAARTWTDSEIEAALLEWFVRHRRLPTYPEWAIATDEHPASRTVVRRGRWRGWHDFLGQLLGLTELEVRDQLGWEARPGVWHRPPAEIEEELRRSARALGRIPTYDDWEGAAPNRPTARAVVRRMGGWTSALRSAGLDPPKPGKSERFRTAMARRREAAAGRRPPILRRLKSPEVAARVSGLGFGDVESYLRTRYLEQQWSPLMISAELGIPGGFGRGPIQRGLDAFGIPRRGRREAQLAVGRRRALLDR